MRLLLALLVVASLSGCRIVTRDSFWDDTKETALDQDPPGLEDRADVPFLGVRVPEEPADFEIGAKVLHVFGSSPAARSGAEPGDEVRSLNGIHVRSAQDLRGALEKIVPGQPVTLVTFHAGAEVTSKVALVRWADYLKERRRRIFADAAYGGMSFPFFFNYVSRELSPAFVKSYFGVDVPKPVVIYEDLDLFPLWKTGIGPYRREKLEIYDCARTKIFCWPFTFTGEPRDLTGTLEGLIPPPPRGVGDL